MGAAPSNYSIPVSYEPNMHRSSPTVLLVLALLALAPARDALAYFDPASGSLVLQMVLGGIAGVALMVRIYWHKLLGLFGIQTSDPRDEGDEESEEGEDAGEDDGESADEGDEARG